MLDQKADSARIHALLIGIAHYLPNALDGVSYPSLAGCVGDVERVEDYLLHRLGVPHSSIHKLTAAPGAEPPEPPSDQPTYENLVAAWKRLTRRAAPGDCVYIHYTGHGGRTKTLVPEIKGAEGFDECLVPVDIGRPESRYLRDVELASLLAAMIVKRLRITLVLDCCHSGGATRGAAAVTVRGTGTVDPTPRPLTSEVGSREALIDGWRRWTRGSRRDVGTASGWLPRPEGYVLLAACRASEPAYEFAFDGVNKSGVLSHWLQESLHRFGPHVDSRTLHDRIVAGVHSRFEMQTPVLEGDIDRAFFDTGSVSPGRRPMVPCSAVNANRKPAVRVLAVDPREKRLRLQIGRVHGVDVGALLAVERADFGDASEPLAVVEVTSLDAATAWARAKRGARWEALEPGARAVLLAPGSALRRPAVGLVTRGLNDAGREEKRALRNARRALRRSRSGFATLADRRRPPTFLVAVNDDREYEIRDPAGEEIAHLHPGIVIDQDEAAERLVARLQHLARYRRVQEIDNPDPDCSLRAQLSVAWGRLPDDYDPTQPPRPVLFPDPGNLPTVRVGDWLGLVVKNRSEDEMNLAVFDLRPDWGIRQIYPFPDSEVLFSLAAGEETRVPMQAYLPAGYEAGKDVIKVFATIMAAPFSCLELPVLAEQTRDAAATAAPDDDPFEALLMARAMAAPRLRSGPRAREAIRQWAVAQKEVRIERRCLRRSSVALPDG